MTKLTKLKISIALLAIVGLAGYAGVYAASATGSAQVTLFTPLTIAQTQGVNFGTLGLDGSGTATITQAGAESCTGFNSAVCPATGAQGVFSISGANSAAVVITYTNGTLKAATGATTITFTPNGPASVTLSASGTATINVGGSLALTGTEIANTYSTANGTAYTVSIHY